MSAACPLTRAARILPTSRVTVLTRGHAEQLVDRYSERRSAAAKCDAGNDLASQSIA